MILRDSLFILHFVDNFRVKTERTGPTKRRAGAGDPEVKLLLSKTGGGGKGGGVGGSNSDGDYQLVQHEVGRDRIIDHW